MGWWTPKGRLVTQHVWNENHQIYSIRITVRCRSHESRRTKKPKPKSNLRTQRQWTSGRLKSNRARHHTSSLQFEQILERNHQMEGQEGGQEEHLCRRLGPQAQAKRRKCRKNGAKVGRPIPRHLQQKARVIPSGRLRRQRAAAFMECGQPQKILYLSKCKTGWTANL